MIARMDAFGAFGPAWERMRRMLFVRSSVGVWFSFGLAFFLQDCVEGGNGYNNYGSGDPSHIMPRSGLEGWETRDLLAVGAVALVLALSLGVLLVWLGSRGQALALRSVMAGRIELGAQWTETRAAGMRLFRWHLGFGAILLALAVGAFFAIWWVASSTRDAPDTSAALMLGTLAGCGLLALPLLALRSVMRNFVFPLVVAKGLTIRAAWTLFWGAARGHLGGLALFFLARLLIGLAGGMAAMVAMAITCCIGALPILHQTIMAPFYVFERSHALYTLASLGPELSLLETPPDDFGGYGASMPGPYYGDQGAPPPAGGFGAPPGV